MLDGAPWRLAQGDASQLLFPDRAHILDDAVSSPFWFLQYFPAAWTAIVLVTWFIGWVHRALRPKAIPGSGLGSIHAFLNLFRPFITEEDVLAVQPDGAVSEAEQHHHRPDKGATRLLLPALTLFEALGWCAYSLGVILQARADHDAKGWEAVQWIWRDTGLRASVLVTVAWIFGFVTAANLSSRQPPYRLLILLILLLTAGIVDITQHVHEYAAVHHHSLKDLANGFRRTPDVLCTTVLIFLILHMPLHESTGVKLPERTIRFAGITRPVSPEDTNTLLGSLTYSWMGPLMSLARERPLVPSDVWALSLFNRAEVLARRFNSLTDKTLLRRLLRASSADIIVDASLKLIAVILSYARPYFIRRILECLTSAASEIVTFDAIWAPRQKAYVYALLGVLCMIGRGLVELQHFHRARRIGMRMRMELTVAVFEKSLTRRDMSGRVTGKTGKDEDKTASVGKVVSLISEDTNRVLRMGCDSHQIYGAPLEIILAVTSLYSLMGWSAIVGFAILVLTAPINYWIGKRAVTITREAAAARDARQAASQELISSIQTVKFFGWSAAWISRVEEKRKAELRWLFESMKNNVRLNLIWIIISFVVPLSAFFCYVKFQHQEMTVAVAFTALSLFSMVRRPLNEIPDFSIRVLQTLVSVKRIESYFSEDDVVTHALPTAREENKEVLAFRGASLQYRLAGEDEFRLRDLSVEFPKGLTVICGPTGSGKTSLLLGLLGELDVLGGEVDLPTTVSYAAQHAWLESTSIRANILFGHPFNRERYEATVNACALRPDLALLPERDGTHVGERGVSLSGGQRARIALARAVYAPTKHVLLDDCLAAVDSHTAKHLLRNVLQGELLRDRTCVLVTHHVDLVSPVAALVLVLENGSLVSQGPPDAVKYAQDEEELAREAEEVAVDEAAVEEEVREGKDGLVEPEGVPIETWATGEVKPSLYWTYIKAGSYSAWAACILLVLTFPAFGFLEQYWLRLWGETSLSGHLVRDNRYLAGYAAIGVGTLVTRILAIVLCWLASYRASKSIFSTLLARVVRAPPRWFDITPGGRITNRFTNDLAIVDESLAGNFVQLATNSFPMFSGLLIVSVILPVTFVPIIAVGLVYLFIFIRYLGVNRDVNRIQSTSASPLFSGFQEALIGITTIRAFGKEHDFRTDLCAVVDSTLALWYCTCTLDIWLSIRSQMLAACCLLVTSIFAIYSRVSPGLAGIAITSSLSIIQCLDWLCSSYGKMVTSFNSLERIEEYLVLDQEPEGGIKPPASWPSGGGKGDMVEVEDLVIKYAQELPSVLNGISFSVKRGERIAIAGRTGSGKSTLAMSLLRFVDPAEGSIRIDGLDITKVNLEILRQRVTLLPQEAVLFGGTIRSNLDPLGEHSDEECLDALRRVHLHDAPSSTTSSTVTPIQPGQAIQDRPLVIARKLLGLDTEISSGGGNLSSGQRQLLALARALLRNSRIIIFDESTASIDFDLDRKIQEAIRTEFHDASLICVAHRLRTIVDYDRVMVLDAGRIVEFDKPARLLQDPEGAFHKLCRESGDYEELLNLVKRD